MSSRPFLPGIELSARFTREAVAPLLAREHPGLRYAAALVGSGSDVLGFDTEMSRDHDWGPAVHLFLEEGDVRLRPALDGLFAHELPETIAGYPVRHAPSSDAASVPRHHVTITTVAEFAREVLGFDIARPIAPADWLAWSGQALLEVTAGAVHMDMTGELSALRARLTWYPDDLWRYLLASAWERIGEEEHLMPRAGFVGDELGSAVIGSRLVRSAMLLLFLQQRTYAPYAKWLGSAFARLAGADEILPHLVRAQAAAGWPERSAALNAAFSILARRQNALGLWPQRSEEPRPFHDRPWQVIHGSEFASALAAEIRDPAVRAIAARGLIGNIDLWSDNVDLHEAAEMRERVRGLWQE